MVSAASGGRFMRILCLTCQYLTDLRGTPDYRLRLPHWVVSTRFSRSLRCSPYFFPGPSFQSASRLPVFFLHGPSSAGSGRRGELMRPAPGNGLFSARASESSSQSRTAAATQSFDAAKNSSTSPGPNGSVHYLSLVRAYFTAGNFRSVGGPPFVGRSNLSPKSQ